jgi:hypothetical protein
MYLCRKLVGSDKSDVMREGEEEEAEEGEKMKGVEWASRAAGGIWRGRHGWDVERKQGILWVLYPGMRQGQG